VGEAVASALEPRALLEQVVAALLDVFPQARSAAAATVDPRTRSLRTVAHRVRADARDSRPTLIPTVVFDRVIHQGHSVLLRAATDRDSALGDDVARAGSSTAASADRGAALASPDGADGAEARGYRMGAPLSFRGEALGMLHVEASPALGSFSQADLDLLGGIAAQAGVALHLSGLHQKLLVRDRLDKDLAIARQIQRNLLPREPPRIPGIEFGVHYEPAFQVGGDFFDFLWLDPTHLGLVIGDVSGKAISGALFMSRVASEFRALAPVEADPRRLLQRVNHAMADASDDGMFCTALVLSLDLERHVVRFTNAGHTVPLLRRDGAVIALEFPEARAMPLGIDARMEAGQAEVELRPGDALLLYTDGLIEGVARDGAQYGQDRLVDVFARAPSGARAALDAVLADLDVFVADAPQSDDQTIVCVGVVSRPVPRFETSLSIGLPPARL
jgi:serine phosphatase RsbU (regulator of sigma subunit)